MRYADIEDEKIKAEQKILLDDYFNNAPEGSSVDEWFDIYASKYYKQFMKDYLSKD